MTKIAFHFNVGDQVDYACRLLRKAVSSGAKVVVLGLPGTLQQLDAALWSFSAPDFVPHCFQDSEASLVSASPVILAASISSPPHRQVLLNLGNLLPDGFEQFERVIEVVGLDDADRLGARSRWKQYTDRGYNITRHDRANKSAL